MRSDRRSSVELRSSGFERLNVCAAVLDRRGVVRETNEAWRLVALLNDGSPEGTGVGANYLDVCDRAAAVGDATAAAAAVGLRQILTGDRGHFDLEYLCAFPSDDRWFLLQASSAPVDDGAGIVLFHVDVTAHRLLAARLGIVDDESTPRSAAHLIADQLRRAGDTVWVMFLDVDGFDAVQDRYGRRAADELFVQVAARAAGAVRASDRFCRLHGDIFVVSCPNLDAIDAAAVAQRLREALSEPFRVGGTDLVVAVSTGCAVTGTGAAIDAVLEAAGVELEGDVERHRTARPLELPPLVDPPSPTIAPDTSAAATFGEMIAGRSLFGEPPPDERTPLPAQVGAAQFQAELLAAAGQAIVAVDVHRTVVYWNRAAEEMYGWSADEAVGRSAAELLPHEETAEQTRTGHAAMRDARSWSSDYVIERRDGTPVSVYATNTPIFDARHQLVLVIGSSIDVTERRAGEAARRQLAAIVDGSGDAIFSTTPDGVVTTWNGAAERLFGWTAVEIIGQPVSVLASPEGAMEQVEMRARLRAGSDYERRETTRRHRDGSVLDVRVSMSTSRDDTGNVIGVSTIAQDITDRLSAQREIHASRAGLAEAQRVAQLGSFEFDVAGDRFVWSDELFRILGLDPATVPTTDVFVAAVDPDDVPGLARAWSNTLQHGASFDVELRMHRAGGEEGVVRARAVPEMAGDGSVVKVAGTVMDDTERFTAERSRRSAETRFEIGFEQSAIGAVITDLAGVPIRVNATICQILGRAPEELLGQRWTAYTPTDQPPLVDAMLAGVRAGRDHYEDERRYIRADGTIVWTTATVTLVRDESAAPQYYFMQLQDITARKRMELELVHQALHDSLTGLANRTLLNERLVEGLSSTRRRAVPLAVIFVDIDQFKLVNDSLGHGHGDELLREAATRITALIRSVDTVARFGGDEFVIVCQDLAEVETRRVADRILQALRRPWQISGREIHVTASLGIAVADRWSTPESLLRDSDAAMYRAKELGGGRIEVFDEALRLKAEHRFATATALHHALANGELRVYYQPVVDVSTGSMVSAEALLRWAHPTRGMLSPVEFIPIAEETGLIISIGAWVLEESCRQLVEWQRIAAPLPGGQQLSIAVNLSVRQLFAADVAGIVGRVLTTTGIRPNDLCLELTESVFMEDVEQFGQTLKSLRELGVHLSIDDFGTGYSSLSYLQRFPVDAVKIDRSFVDVLDTEVHDRALVAAILAMANALDLSVIAEGVETHQQLTVLKQLGVRRMQGFYLAHPMPADDLTALLTAAHRWDIG